MINSLYLADVTPLEDEALFLRAYGSVSYERKNKIDRLAKKEDKRRSVAAELLLRYALKVNGVAELPEIVLGAKGKPYFESGNLFFSLSHSGDKVCCALSLAEVGCDIEKIKKADLKTAGRFFSSEENLMLSSLSDESEKDELFFRLWTLKESYMKATGKGLSLPFREAVITFGKDGISAGNGEYRFFETDMLSGYKCSVCVKGKDSDFTVKSVGLKEMLLSAF